MKNEKEILEIAREKQKPKLLFECADYIIEKIPLNYRITIKCAKRNKNQGIERDWFSVDDFGIESAHKVAKDAIEEFFKKGVVPVNPFA